MKKNILPATYLDSLFPRLQEFINDTLCNEDVDDDLYVGGSNRIEFFASHLRREIQLDIENHSPTSHSSRRHDFEEALYERLLQPRNFNLLVLLGGLGAGKTTTVKYILRRFNERYKKLMESFHCVCTECFRRPAYLDFRALGPNRAIRLESVVPDVFREMRLMIFEKLIGEWLNRSGNTVSLIRQTDPKFLVLRRLFIANDLFHFHGGDHPGLSQLHCPELALDTNLTASKLTDQELIKLIGHYKQPARAYESRLRGVSENPDHSQDFMVLTLNYFMQKCNPANPTNLIVLDNLDQLPTQHIEDLLRELHDLADRARCLPLLVPLRPSSINPYSFIRDIQFRYHYGPNNFTMILSRLERFVLSQSREELRVPRGAGNDKPFPTVPSETEIDALLIVSYLYAKIMAAGIKEHSKVRDVIVHNDHAFLECIDVGKGTLLGLAETCDALVGACCRYGIDLVQRFFINSYGNPTISTRAMSVHAAHENGRRIRFGYATLVSNLLRDPVGAAQSSRVANLFQPTRSSSNPGWPSLTKLRVLSLLTREKRQEVHTIVQRLGLLGIPAELTIDALNTLQDKFRLLLWFSTNRPLDLADASSLGQDVVISEHGERYFRRVVGDFEYIWYCATALQERKYSHEGLKFTIKLNDYKGMIQRVGITEWKQIGFSRLREGTLPDITGVGRATQMEVLNVLYSSLGRALLGAGIAMRVHGETRSLMRKLLPLVVEICEQILFWQSRYEMAYGSNFYLSVYSEQIKDLQHDILELRRTKSSDLKELTESLNQVEASWVKDPKSAAPMSIGEVVSLPEEDIVTLIAKYGRGVLPGVKDWLNVIDKQRAISLFTTRFLTTRGELTALLESRLPTYSEILRYTSYLLADIQAVVSSGMEVAATGEGLLRWCVEERATLQRINDDLKDNRYNVPELCEMSQMSELKGRYNNIIAAIENLARHFGVPNTEHLSYRWQ